MTVTIFVPRDAAALAVGADKVAKAIEQEIAARGLDARVVLGHADLHAQFREVGHVDRRAAQFPCQAEAADLGPAQIDHAGQFAAVVPDAEDMGVGEEDHASCGSFRHRHVQ